LVGLRRVIVRVGGRVVGDVQGHCFSVAPDRSVHRARAEPSASVYVNVRLTCTFRVRTVECMVDQAQDDGLSLSELAAAVDRAAGAAESPVDPGAIQRADRLVRRSQARLVDLVVAARSSGVSWQAIGDALGVSRQAAFKRFGGAVMRPEKEMEMTGQTIDLMDRTRAVFESLDAGDYEAVRAQMTYACARALSRRKVQGVWNEVVTATGRLEASTDLTVQTPDGTNALNTFANRLLANGAVVQATLRHEAGEWIGRVAYNGSGKITGLLIAPSGARDLPF